MWSVLEEHMSTHSRTPFFLYMAYQQAHAPNKVEEEDLNRVMHHLINVKCGSNDICRKLFESNLDNWERAKHLGEIVAS